MDKDVQGEKNKDVRQSGKEAYREQGRSQQNVEGQGGQQGNKDVPLNSTGRTPIAEQGRSRVNFLKHGRCKKLTRMYGKDAAQNRDVSSLPGHGRPAEVSKRRRTRK